MQLYKQGEGIPNQNKEITMIQDAVRKTVYFNETLWNRIEDIRFEQRIRTEADVIRMLLEAGLYLLQLKSDPMFDQYEQSAIERLNNQG